MFHTLAMGGNPTAWMAIALLVVLLFGANRIPEIMKSLATGLKDFKKGLEDEEEESTKKPSGS